MKNHKNLFAGCLLVSAAVLMSSQAAHATKLWVFVPGGQFYAFTTPAECIKRYGSASKCALLSKKPCAGYKAVILGQRDYDTALRTYKSGKKVNVVRQSDGKQLCNFQK